MLICGYFLSPQVQVKANLRSVVPFHLLLRDPASHIATLQENRTFAEDATEELAHDNEDEYADRKFTVRVAKSDNYFPVLRYKCSPELRPVPIVCFSLWILFLILK